MLEKNSNPLNLKDPDLLRMQGLVAGEWCDADNGKTLEVVNPATGEIIGTAPMMGAAETRRAIEAAKEAMPGWASKTAKERAAILRKWNDLLLENTEDLAKIMTVEMGKPLAEAKGEVAYAASFIEWFAEEGKRIYGDTIPEHQSDKRIVVIKQPIGVTVAITPWNFPIAMITRKAAPALAAGCPMVIKPAELTPYSAFAMAVLAERAGIPSGILGIVTGDAPAIGSEMTSNPLVQKLTFTGSTAVGKQLMEQCASTVKKTSMELGGNAPFIVFDDADLDEAVEAALASKYRNSGQTCVCANRMYIQEGIHDAFVKKLAEKVSALKVGNGLDDGVSQGPLITEAAVEKVEDHIADALSKGAKVEMGGKRHTLGQTFFEPTILTGVTQEMKVAKEETFGPMAPIFKFSDEQDVITLANDTEFGLAAYLCARDIGRIWRVSEALEYGIVGINTGIISTEMAPFGGVKQSGIGREGSKYGIDDYLEIKYMCIGGINS